MWKSYTAYKFLMVTPEPWSIVPDSPGDNGKFCLSSHFHFYEAPTLEPHIVQVQFTVCASRYNLSKIIATYLLASKEKACIREPKQTLNTQVFYSTQK